MISERPLPSDPLCTAICLYRFAGSAISIFLFARVVRGHDMEFQEK